MGTSMGCGRGPRFAIAHAAAFAAEGGQHGVDWHQQQKVGSRRSSGATGPSPDRHIVSGARRCGRPRGRAAAGQYTRSTNIAQGGQPFGCPEGIRIAISGPFHARIPQGCRSFRQGAHSSGHGSLRRRPGVVSPNRILRDGIGSAGARRRTHVDAIRAMAWCPGSARVLLSKAKTADDISRTARR